MLLDHQIPRDPEMLALEDTYRPKVEAITKKVIGKTRVYLDGSNCRFYECNIGNLVSDALVSARVEQQTTQYMTDASIALILSGDIRASIKMGEMTISDLETALPYQNPLGEENVAFLLIASQCRIFLTFYGIF